MTTTRIADDFAAINARVAEIEAEKLRAPAEQAIQEAVENYEAKEVQHQTYFGWDIYAPVNLDNVNG